MTAAASLVLTSMSLPTAAVGPASRLPLLHRPDAPGWIGSGVPGDVAARATSGSPPSLFPYTPQDDYGRSLAAADHRVAVLENDALRATVAVDLGGRLWSLYDKRARRELLYVNPVLQPANLALRNAWFSGGVEWNIGTRGHSPTTMSSLFAARVERPDGSPLLRLWEWERLREVIFQVDLWLPPGAGALAATVRVRNVNDASRPMYWWTNAAVVADAGTRVIAPASRAFRTVYPDGLDVVDVPDRSDGDSTVPASVGRAADWFFDVATDQRPWIVAVGADGTGIAHTSTAMLRGRKLFVWGTGRGGERWQRWLSGGADTRYAEIQGGLAPTQYEHVVMPPRTDWCWTETFGPVRVDAPADAPWPDAVTSAGRGVERSVPADALASWHADATEVLDLAPAKVLGTGTGWGALERRRRAAAGEAWCGDTGTPFDDGSLGPEQAPWCELLETGALAGSELVSHVHGGDWDARLAAAPTTWLTEYHRAAIAHGRGDLDAAVAHYDASLRMTRSPWALRGRSVAARDRGRADEAAALAVEAAHGAPHSWRLAVEALARLLDAGRPRDAVELAESLPTGVRSRGRVRLLEAWAAAESGAAARAAAILEAGVDIADLREGERSLDALWLMVHPDLPLPERYDFRMHA